MDNIKILSECYTPDMEILTEKGFVLFPDLTPDMKVAQWDKNTREISFDYPTAYINKPYSGNVLTFKTANGYDFTVTENHELVYADWSKKVISTGKYSDIKGTTCKNFIVSGYASGSDDELTPIEKLFIAYQADGSHLRGPLVRGESSGQYTIEFGFSKERKYKHLMSIIEEGGFKYSLLDSSHLNYNLTIYLRDKPSKLLREVFDHTNFSLSKAKQFIEEVAQWDGSVDKQSYITYVTTVQDNADFVQEVALMAGYKTKKRVVEDNRSDKFSTNYRVGINTNSDGFAAFPRNKGKGTSQSMRELIYYDGNVHCVSMPKGTVIVRRNGLVNFNGNCYDLGNKEVTYTKAVEFRSKEIEGQPVSALFVGSPGHILYDETTKKKFHVAFMSKLARRCWFCYTPERMYEPDFTSEHDPIKAMQEHEYQVEAEAAQAITALRDEVNNLTEYNLSNLNNPVKTTPEVFELFNIYKRYNREVVDHSNNQESVYALVRAHLQWKALKLAGALAIIEQSDVITERHYITAVQYCELYDQDISLFEKDINKASHERLSDYLRKLVNEVGRSFISVHDIKKLGFSTAVSYAKLHEMATLCAGYDVKGIYTVAENNSGINFESLRVTDILGCSYKKIDVSRLEKAMAKPDPDPTEIKKAKEAIGWTANNGYKHIEATFANLAEMLHQNLAYTPFEFKDGIRSRDNIVGGTKWVVFDIDKTTLSYEDAHFILDGVNHHIALTSDANNIYKYRVLVELDAYLELSAIAWKHFCTELSYDLGLTADILPQSQIFYAYENRPVLSVIDGIPVSTRDYVIRAKEKEMDQAVKEKPPTTSQMKQLLDNPMGTFWYAFECEKGTRSVTLYRAVRHALDLGADIDYVLDLLDQINTYLTNPMEEEPFVKLKEQALRLYQQTYKES